MATPLRKDEPQFEDEGITTADLAQGKRPVSATPGPQVVAERRTARIANTVEREPDWVCRRTAQGRRAGGWLGSLGDEAPGGGVRRGACWTGKAMGSRRQCLDGRFTGRVAE